MFVLYTLSCFSFMYGVCLVAGYLVHDTNNIPLKEFSFGILLLVTGVIGMYRLLRKMRV